MTRTYPPIWLKPFINWASVRAKRVPPAIVKLELAVKSLQFEAVDFITKPIDYGALKATLRRVHERIWMREQLRQYTEGRRSASWPWPSAGSSA